MSLLKNLALIMMQILLLEGLKTVLGRLDTQYKDNISLVNDELGKIIKEVKDQYRYSTSNLKIKSLSIVNSEGQEVVIIATSTKGGGYIAIKDSEEKNRVELFSAQGSGHGYIKLYSGNDSNFLSAGVDEDDVPFLKLATAENNNIILKALVDGGVIELLDKNGEESVTINSPKVSTEETSSDDDKIDEDSSNDKDSPTGPTVKPRPKGNKSRTRRR